MLVPTFEVYFFMGKTRKKQRQDRVEVKLGDYSKQNACCFDNRSK